MEHRQGIFVFSHWTNEKELELACKTVSALMDPPYPFPFHRILGGLASLHQTALNVQWTHPPGSNLLGQYWNSGVITLIQGWPEASAAALAHEIGHAVDFMSLTDEKRRRLHEVLHERPGPHYRSGEVSMDNHLAAEGWWGYDNPPGGGDVEYWNRPLEGYAQAFLESFVPEYDMSDYVHGVTTDVNKALIRSITLEGPPAMEPFTDVQPDNPHYAAIMEMADLGIAQGKSNGDGTMRFEPRASVTREQMCTFLSRTLKEVDRRDSV